MAKNYNSLEDLKAIFDAVDEVIYFDKSPEAGGKFPDDVNTYELPVGDGNVTLNTGDPDITRTKLTTQETWSTLVKRGEEDFSLNVLSVSDVCNAIFFDQVTATAPDLSTMKFDKTGSDSTGSVDSRLTGFTSSAAKGYSLSPKKVTGAILLLSQSKQCAILFPSIEAYGTFNGPDDNGPAYIKTGVSVLKDAQGVEFYVYDI